MEEDLEGFQYKATEQLKFGSLVECQSILM